MIAKSMGGGIDEGLHITRLSLEAELEKLMEEVETYWQ